MSKVQPRLPRAVDFPSPETVHARARAARESHLTRPHCFTEGLSPRDRHARAMALRKETLTEEQLGEEIERVKRLIDVACSGGKMSVAIATIAVADCANWCVRARAQDMAEGWEQDLPGKVRTVVDRLAVLFKRTATPVRTFRFVVVDTSFYDDADRRVETCALLVAW